MAKINKIKIMLQNILNQFGSVTTDKGILQYDGEELEVGVGVVLVDEEGNESVAEDGNYYLGEEDGRTLVVENSAIKEIIVPEEETPAEETTVEAEDEETVEVAQEIVDEVAEVVEEVVDEVPDENAQLRTKIEELEALIAELKSRIEALEKEPAADTVTEEFKSKNPLKETGVKKLDRLARIMNA